jgi:hypothetical protein
MLHCRNLTKSVFLESDSVALIGKVFQEIRVADLQELVNSRIPEDNVLEYKSQALNPAAAAKALDAEKDELLTDIMALANASGGHLLIGIQTDSQECARGFLPMHARHAKDLATQLRDLCAAHITPIIEGLEIQPFCLDNSKDEWLVIVAMPVSGRKPHMSAFRQQTKFSIRFGNRKREMTYEEILQAFTARNDQYFAQILSKLDSFTVSQTTKPLTEAELDEVEWWQITGHYDLSSKLRRDFSNRSGQNRFFRLVAIPTVLQDYAAKIGEASIQQLLLNSIGRRDGWTTRASPPIRRTRFGYESENIEFHHVRLLNNGALEFSTAIDQYFCWRQPPDSIEKHPRLYPYAVVEFPLSFCRQYLQIVSLLRVTSDVIFQMEYHNIEGAILLPFRPESVGYALPLEPVRAWDKKNLILKPQTAAYPFVPEEVTYSMLLDLYHSFGYEERHVPFRKPDGSFEF